MKYIYTKRDESGMVTAFVVVMTMALLLMAGLVFDGGMGIAAKRRAINEAEAAARSGAQALDVSAYRSTGISTLDAEGARRAAQSYIDATGDTGEIVIEGDRITVTVHHQRSTSILGIAGVGTMTVSGTGSATGVRRVEGPQ